MLRGWHTRYWAIGIFTLAIDAKAARVTHSRGGGAGALQAVVACMTEVLGAAHPQTLKYEAALREMHCERVIDRLGSLQVTRI